MRYRYQIVDVFTSQRFAGNPLAVLPQAEGLSAEQMQAIAREFNFSETTFVTPAASAENYARVRIFTPERELPFAGHPNIGTAFVLSGSAARPRETNATTLRFEEIAGIVPVTVRWEDRGVRYCELTAPQPLELGPEITQDADLADLAWSLCLEENDLVTAVHYPRVASVGLPFLCVEVGNRAALGRAWLRKERWQEISGRVGCGSVHVYTRDGGDPQYAARCRMFMGTGAVREDPATGSANCALAALLASCETQQSGTFAYRIAQGVEMGRSSELFAAVDKFEGNISAVRIGGHCVMVAEGQIRVE